MGLWQRLFPRASDPNPLDDRFYEIGTGFPSRAGVSVTADSARKISAVYRCVSILANAIAMFPKGMYEKLDRGRREATDHPLHPLISFKPNSRQSAFEFWRLLAHHLVLRQNAFCQIVQGPPGRAWVRELIPLHPDRVYGPELTSNGRLRYEYWSPKNERFPLIAGLDIWPIQGLSDDGLRGLSMMEVASDSIGTAAAADRHAARFFERGVKATGVLESDKSYKPEVANAMGESFSRKYGGEEGMRSTPVLWDGVKFKAVNMTLKDAQFLESRQFSVSEIARWFGVPPHMVGDVERSTSWGTGIEQQGLHFLIYSLLPYIELLEQGIRFNLVVQSDRYYPKFNVGKLLQMDQKTQADVFAVLIDKGVMSPNECRELLDRNPREGGDEYKGDAPPPAPPAPAQPPEPPQQQDPSPDPQPQQRALPATAEMVVRRYATEIVQEEEQALARLAKKHARDSKEWRAAIGSFYGRFAERVAESGLLTIDQARAWCRSRRDVVIEKGGLFELSIQGTSAATEVLLEAIAC